VMAMLAIAAAMIQPGMAAPYHRTALAAQSAPRAALGRRNALADLPGKPLRAL